MARLRAASAAAARPARSLGTKRIVEPTGSTTAPTDVATRASTAPNVSSPLSRVTVSPGSSRRSTMTATPVRLETRLAQSRSGTPFHVARIVVSRAAGEAASATGHSVAAMPSSTAAM